MPELRDRAKVATDWILRLLAEILGWLVLACTVALAAAAGLCVFLLAVVAKLAVPALAVVAIWVLLKLAGCVS